MNYIGEQLLPGQLGHFFIVLSFVASLVATFAYFMETKSSMQLPPAGYRSGWKQLARIAFIIEAVSIVAIFSILFYIIYNHLFEYHYAWKHSSTTLEVKYLLACFWEGQEGSFLLWSFWHCILGLIIIRTGKQWEAPVMTIISLAQVFLSTMVIGIYFFGKKIGANPFILLRDSGVLDEAKGMHVNMDLSLPLREDYLKFVYERDGNDLNPLLQNYWMVIHPPVLFLGFASTIVPFAFAMAGLWTRRVKEWVNQALPWSLFSAAVLGVGIMMGAAWAYESLNFGGYWAWDPVENASLVPWLILVAGIHTLLIYKHSGYSLRSTYVFLVLTFIFILYSTFLTRSGILGDTSVHAFTDLGMNAQLFLFLYGFIWLCPIIAANTFNKKIITLFSAIILALACYYLNIPGLPLFATVGGIVTMVVFMNQQVPTIKKEEHLSSREFWIFIGSLVFFLSGMIIIAKTSLPVINKLFDLKLAAPEDEEYAHNQIQILIAIILGVLTAITQYFKYKETPFKFFWKKIAIPTLVAAIVATLVLWFGDINYEKHGLGFLIQIWIAIVASIYAVVANAMYIWLGMKGKLELSGGSVSHVGFGLVLLGIFLSSAKKEILSFNTSGIAIPFAADSREKTGENLTLVRGIPMSMGKYHVTYVKDSMDEKKKDLWYYEINFKSKEGKEEFTLWPNAFVNYKDNNALMANPDARHYLDHDIFTYISSLPLSPDKVKDTAQFKSNLKGVGDTIYYSKGYMVIDKINVQADLPLPGMSPTDTAIAASLRIQSFSKSKYSTDLVLIKSKGGMMKSNNDTIMSESMILRLNAMENGKVDIGVKESDSLLQYVTLKAYKFPYINILWTGIIITAIGILMSMVRRIQINRLKKA